MRDSENTLYLDLTLPDFIKLAIKAQVDITKYQDITNQGKRADEYRSLYRGSTVQISQRKIEAQVDMEGERPALGKTGEWLKLCNLRGRHSVQ